MISNKKGIEMASLLLNHVSLKMKLIGGEKGLSSKVTSIDVNRPGLALAGFFENFAHDRVQVFGKGEYAYLQKMVNKKIEQDSGEDLSKITGKLDEVSREIFSYTIPGIIFTYNKVPPEIIIQMSNEKKIPLMSTPLSTHNFIVEFTRILGEVLAPRKTLHGVFLEVFGVGVLLLGKSGIGKSETAIELIERGHRLVADDVVQVVRLEGKLLYGLSSDFLQYNMELRGLGIVNVRELFGMRAIRERYSLDLAIYLEVWNSKKEYERLGIDEEYLEILDVQVPRVLLPVRPGRNIPILIETAAINYRSQKLGYHAARELSKKVSQKVRESVLKNNQEKEI